jgi:LCP family protein required for cell wall assembly
MEREPINLLKGTDNPLISPPKHRKTRLIASFFVVLAVFTGAVYTSAYITHRFTNSGSATGNQKVLTPKKLSFFQTVRNFFFQPENLLEGQKDDRVNILVLGMGGAGHDGPYLTDTNMIVSIKPSTNQVALISIPRDLAVKIPSYGLHKINHVNSFGEELNRGEGGEYARKFFSETFDLPIPYYVRVDFKAFEEVIDTIGGVTINVPKDFTDNLYPGPNDSYQVVSFKAGEQTLNGERALIYSRSRHGGNGEGSDFARARRQQQIISALKEKILSAGTYTNPVTVKKIFDSLSAHVTTNLDLKQMMYLASLGKEIDNNVKTLVLDNSPNGFLVATAGSNFAPRGGNFSAVNAAFKNIFDTTTSTAPGYIATTSAEDQTQTPVFSNAKIEIQNGTWQMGLASRVKQHLQDRGLSVFSIGNSVKRPISTTTIYVLRKNSSDEVVSTLSKELKAQVSNTVPDWLSNPPTNDAVESREAVQPDTDILVILGSDIREKFNL